MDLKLRHRVTALVVMALIASAFTWAAWWTLQDGAAADDWLIRAIRAANVLLLSRTGVKTVLLVVVAAAAGAAWFRSRRRRERQERSSAPGDRSPRRCGGTDDRHAVRTGTGRGPRR